MCKNVAEVADVFINVQLIAASLNSNTNKHTYTVFQKKVVHQAHIDNLVNSQRIFKILSLAHSVENLL